MIMTARNFPEDMSEQEDDQLTAQEQMKEQTHFICDNDEDIADFRDVIEGI